MDKIICLAIRNLKVLTFDYNGFKRVVEPHTLGINTKRNILLSAYQIAGGSNSIEVPDWGLFDLEKMKNLNVEEVNFRKSRIGYKRGDSRMVTILCQL